MLFCTLVGLISLKWILWEGCSDGKCRNLSLEIHQWGGYLPFILPDLGPPVSEPWEINLCWPTDGFQQDSSQCGAPVGAWKEGAEWGWVIFGPALNRQLHCGSGFQWSSELLPASPLCDHLYFQIPVMSSAPYLFSHGVARSVFQPKELPWSSWHFLLTDLPLPIPLLNSSKGLPRWH